MRCAPGVVLATGLAAVVPLVALWPLLAGHMPVSHDHPAQLYNAWHFWNQALLHGRLSAWDGTWAFGTPAHDLYPIGSYAWVALFRGLSFGSLSWQATYGLALAAALAFSGVAMLRLGRRLFGLTAALLASLLFSLDPGAPWEGGWHFTVVYGVWGQTLAISFLLVALERGIAFLDGEAGSHSAIAWLAAALLTHPIVLMLLAFFVPALLVSRAISRSGPSTREASAALGWIVAALLLAAFWLLPFVSRSDYVVTAGRPWLDLPTILAGLLRGDLFEAGRVPIYLSLFAVGIAIRQRRWQGLWLGTVGFGLLVVASSTVSESLQAISGAFDEVVYQRLLLPAKRCFFLLAGWVSATAIHTGWRAFRDGSGAGRPARVAAGLLCFAAVGALLLRDVSTAVENSAALELDGRVDWWEHREELSRWQAETREREPEFFRVAYWLDPHDHRLSDLPIESRTAGYKVGATPARLFRLTPYYADPKLLRQLSVKYVVSNQPRRELAARAVELFGEFLVYELNDFTAQRFTLEGSGEIDVLRFDDEVIHLRLVDVSPGARLVLHVAHYPRWRARLDGEEVLIERARVDAPDRRRLLMAVPVRSGELLLEYRRAAVDWWGAALSSTAAVVFLVSLLRRRRRLGLTCRRRTDLPR